MDKLSNLQELIEGAKAQCGTGIMFWAAMAWLPAVCHDAVPGIVAARRV
jgi:hypothetical protein